MIFIEKKYRIRGYAFSSKNKCWVRIPADWTVGIVSSFQEMDKLFKKLNIDKYIATLDEIKE